MIFFWLSTHSQLNTSGSEQCKHVRLISPSVHVYQIQCTSKRYGLMEHEPKARKVKDKKCAHTQQPTTHKVIRSLNCVILNWTFCIEFIFIFFSLIRHVYTSKYMFGQTSVKTKWFTQRTKNQKKNTAHDHNRCTSYSCENNRLTAKIPTTITFRIFKAWLEANKFFLHILFDFTTGSDESQAKIFNNGTIDPDFWWYFVWFSLVSRKLFWSIFCALSRLPVPVGCCC